MKKAHFTYTDSTDGEKRQRTRKFQHEMREKQKIYPINAFFLPSFGLCIQFQMSFLGSLRNATNLHGVCVFL